MIYKLERIYIVFVYGADYSRQLNSFGVLWEGVKFWILSATFIVSSIAMHHLRHAAHHQSEHFMSGGGHSWKKRIYAAALIASFSVVSIHLANFLVQVPQKVNTFEKLANRNVTFHMSTLMTDHKANIVQMLR